MRGTPHSKSSALHALGVAALALILASAACAAREVPATEVPDPIRFPEVLVFSKTSGFRHDSIPDGIAAVQQLGVAWGFEVTATEDASVFDKEHLARFSAIVFMSTTGDLLSPPGQSALEHYVRGGGGFVGIHAAADAEYDWPFYGELIGARFASHPPGTHDASIDIEDASHPSTETLPKRWTRHDEWYNFASNPRHDTHVLAVLDESSYSGGNMGDHPIAWCRQIDAGRAWYTAGGHTAGSYAEPGFISHLAGGIRWAAGIVSAECLPGLGKP